MNRLILFRHAKAESEAASGDDFDRALSGRGRREAKAMGAHLAAHGFRPDLALVSSAVRTRQTWELAEESLGGAEVRFEPDLYNADAAAILALAEAAGAGRSVVVVAHNPGLQELAVRLLRDGEAAAGLLTKAHRDFPPAAAAVFDIDDDGRPLAQGVYFPERER